MEQKKLMLLGGLRYLLPVIKAAHKLGYYVITCDYLPNNIAHKYSDEYVNVSIIDKEAVLKAAQEKQTKLAADPHILPEKNAQGGIDFASRSRRPDIPEDNISLQIDRAESKTANNLHEQIEKNRELTKLRVRQEKAVKKAMREAKKADKYYEQALRESKKRR